MKHSYRAGCPCPRCTREAARRATVSERNRPVAQAMLDWRGSRNRRRARVADEYWNAYESGRPMSSDDY